MQANKPVLAMNSLPAAFLLISLALLFGCLQSGIPSECSGVSSSKLANCIYVKAVSEQNPLRCYALQEKDRRASCMKDATNPAARNTLGRIEESQRESVFTEPSEPAKPETPPQKPAEKPARFAGCDSAPKEEQDVCLRESALNSSTMAICEQIKDTSILQNCITQIARMTKRPEICDSLKSKDNAELCRLYAKGGE
jgi:hypothetical protein